MKTDSWTSDKLGICIIPYGEIMGIIVDKLKSSTIYIV
jgi:hypothetical protein